MQNVGNLDATLSERPKGILDLKVYQSFFIGGGELVVRVNKIPGIMQSKAADS